MKRFNKLALFAGVAELADAQDLGSCGRKAVGVQLPPSAPNKLSCFHSVDGTVDAVYPTRTLRLRLRLKYQEGIVAQHTRNVGL
jgi:hypothetical protein